MAFRILADQCELAQIRDQHKTIAGPVASDLLAHRPCLNVPVRGFHLDHATLRKLPLARTTPLHLLCRVEAEVRMSCPLIGQFPDAENPWFERRSDAFNRVASGP